VSRAPGAQPTRARPEAGQAPPEATTRRETRRGASGGPSRTSESCQRVTGAGAAVGVEARAVGTRERELVEVRVAQQRGEELRLDGLRVVGIEGAAGDERLDVGERLTRAAPVGLDLAPDADSGVAAELLGRGEHRLP
jgi:hypothetical protein